MLDEEVDGGWNIQADAPMTHLVDFSHWFVLPMSRLPEPWKMSKEAVKTAFKLGVIAINRVDLQGGDFLGLFEYPSISQLVYETDDTTVIKQRLSDEKERLSNAYKEVGEFGRKKPSFSWSWFLEVDDSEVMKRANKAGKSIAQHSLIVRDGVPGKGRR